METPPEKSGLTKRNKRTLIITIAAIVLCCLILTVLGIALYSWDAIQGGRSSQLPVEYTVLMSVFGLIL